MARDWEKDDSGLFQRRWDADEIAEQTDATDKMFEECDVCGSIAVWHYSPIDNDSAYCDTHVPRGCSCMTDEDGVCLTDEYGREAPCCEYDYNPDGWLR